MSQEGEDDPQKIKRIAAAAYEYERDPRWEEYWSNVLIPPHMASRSDVLDHFKRKFYKRYVDPDIVVEPISSSSSQSTRVKNRTGGANFPEQARAENAGDPDTRSTRTAPQGTSSTQSNKQAIQFFINSWVLLATSLSILPVMPRNLTSKAHQLSLLGMMFSSIFSLYHNHGKPSAWNMPAFQTWFQSIILERDFLYLVYSLIFVPFPAYFKSSLLPLLVRAMECVAKFVRRSFSHSSLYRCRCRPCRHEHPRGERIPFSVGFIPHVMQQDDRATYPQGGTVRKYLEDACLWVEVNTTTLRILSSNVEVALGFLLILSLFSWKRNIILMFIYWHLLKLMYHVPATATYHQNVWAKIGRTVSPYINRYVPSLNFPLSAVQRWWLH